MTRRRVLLLVPVAVAVALIAAGWLLWPRPSAITEENARKIKEGMTRTDVEAILGGSARDDTGGTGQSVYFCTAPDDVLLKRAALPFVEWIGPTCAIAVEFEGDNVVSVQAGVTRHRDASVIQRVRRWLRL
jgi:SmpA / OmlA family